MTWSEMLDAFSGLGTFLVAAIGVGAWRKQLRGNAQHEVSRALLREGLLLRNAIHAARCPVMLGEEQVRALRLEGVPEQELVTAAKGRGFDAAMRMRLDDAWKRSDAFSAQRVEGEVLWGPEHRARTAGLVECLIELSVKVESFLSARRDLAELPQCESDPIGRRKRAMELEADRRVAMGMPTDDFGRRVDAAAAALQALVRPHLAPGWRLLPDFQVRAHSLRRRCGARIAKCFERGAARLVPPEGHERDRDPTRASSKDVAGPG